MSLEKQKQVIGELFSNFWWRLTNLYFITNEHGETIQFKPNTIQRSILEERSGYRDIILKYRQGGVSTLFIILMLDDVLFGGKNRNNVFITHRQDLLNEFFKKLKFIYDNIPETYKVLLPQPSTDNANELAFKKTRSGMLLNNSIKIGLDVRGRTPTMLHVSEFAFMDVTKQIQLKLSIDQFRKTAITIETTANGIGNTFYRACMQAKNGEGTYKLLFYPWYIEERNRLNIPEGYEFILDEKEKQLKELYNLSNEQLYWRRVKIQDANALGEDGEQLFNQENPTTIETAFISSGVNVFDLSINFDIKQPYKEWNGWKLFQPPQDKLIAGVDLAEGGIKGDFSTISFRNINGELVATFKAKVTEVILAQKLDEFFHYEENGKKYIGIVIPENNVGLPFIKECQNYEWFGQRIVPEKKLDKTIDEEGVIKKYGFRTTKKSKDFIIRNYKKLLNNKEIDISEEIYAEITTYQFDNNNRPNAIAPNHDDLLMADMICCYGLEEYKYNLLEYGQVKSQFANKTSIGTFTNFSNLQANNKKNNGNILNGEYSREDIL